MKKKLPNMTFLILNLENDFKNTKKKYFKKTKKIMKNLKIKCYLF
jgi:hypothetical protein